MGLITVSTKQLHKYLVASVKGQMNTLIIGSPGIGKSDIIEGVASELDYDLVIFHPVTSDPTDFKGMPFFGNGKFEYILDAHLRKLIDATRPTIAFFDDMGQAPAGVQASCMQILQARRINGHKISDHVTFVAASNRRKDGSGVSGILEALKSRFRPILELEPDLESWIAWAQKNNMPHELISFLRFRPDLLNDPKPSKDLVNFPCPRTIAAVGVWMNMGFYDATIYAGCAGEAFATELNAYIKIYSKLPSIDSIVKDPNKAPVPEKGEPAKLYATASMLAKHVNETNIDQLCKYAERIPPEFYVLFMKDAINQHPTITNTTAFKSWASTYNGVYL